MERYIEQLVADLAKAEANPTLEPDYGESYEEFEKTMLEIEEGKKIPAKKMLNISYEELPPVEKLSKEHLEKLLPALMSALSAKGTTICIPGGNVPDEIVYREIRELFIEGFNAMPGWVMDFCSGYCPDCAFVDYCETCKESWTKDEIQDERNSD